MSENRSSGDQIAIADARNFNVAVQTVLSFLFVTITGSLLLIGGELFRLTWLSNVLTVVLLFGWIALLFIFAKPRIISPGEHFGEDYLRATIDLQHRRGRFTLIFMVANFLVLTVELANASAFDSAYSRFSYIAVLAFSFLAILSALTVSYGPGFFLPFYRRAISDELIRSHQAKAMQLGFLLAVFEFCTVLVFTVIKRDWVIPSMPIAIAGAIVLPTIYFLILQWRADKDG